MQDAFSAFANAAKKKGAYAEQIATGTAAVDAAFTLDAKSQKLRLLAMQPEMARLLINIACRIGQRDPALRPQRDALSALNSRVNAKLKSLGVVRPRSDGSNDCDAGGTGVASASAECALLRNQGHRHLCEHGCYLNAYESCRRLHAAQAETIASVARRHGESARAATPDRQHEPKRRRAVADAAIDAPPGSSAAAAAVQRHAPPPPPRSLLTRSPPRVVTSRFFATSAVHSSAVSECVASSAATATSAGCSSTSVSSGCAEASALARSSREAPLPSPPSPTSPAAVVAASTASAAADGCSPASNGSPASGGGGGSGGKPRRRVAAVAVGLRRRAARLTPWRPPHSPYGLLEELVWDRPWALLLACILLNQTTRAQVHALAWSPRPP